MRISREKLMSESASTGFRSEMLEKVINLLSLLEGLQSHPYLRDRIVLKGGTALNLFLFDIPRLSVDIDMNYIGASDRETMLAERPRVEQAVAAVCGREGLSIERMPEDHAGGKWRLRYGSALAQGGNLELDLNFMYRIPLWPVIRRDSCMLGSFCARNIAVLDEHELAAGKLAALLDRHAARDLFDVHHLLNSQDLDQSKLRLAFVVYGAMNRRDWRTVSTDNISFDSTDLREILLPVLRTGYLSEVKDPDEWAKKMVDECCTNLGVVLPFTNQEREFLDCILDHGEIEPSLLTEDPEMIDRIQRHPWLLWKAQNARSYKNG